MTRVFNFSPGPAMLPEAVLHRAQEELLDWHNHGVSVMEMSHRDKDFLSIVAETEQNFRALLNIPANYKVLFLPGGARLQFAMVPINLLRGKKSADYLLTGYWSKVAIAEAKRFCDVAVVGQTQTDAAGLMQLPSVINDSADAAYVHYTANETIEGVEFFDVPHTRGGAPLVADMTSNLLSMPLPIHQFGIIYASAQKNLGQAGITAVIIREDLAGHALPGMPSMLDYKLQIDNESAYNTPPTYAWYICGLMLDWVKNQGGVAAMAQQSERKANKLYQCIDNSAFYTNKVHPSCRSRMNIPFLLSDAALDDLFLREAKQHALMGLKGHRAVGGMRASLYLGMPEAGVDALIAFMQEFEQRHS